MNVEVSFVGQVLIGIMLIWLMWRYENKTETMKKAFEERAENVRRIFETQVHQIEGAIAKQSDEIQRLREAVLAQSAAILSERHQGRLPP